MRRTLRAPVTLIATALTAGTVAVAVPAPSALAAPAGSPQDCIESLQCTPAQFDTWTMDQRQSFVRGLQDGYAQEFHAGFVNWRTMCTRR